MPNTKRGFGSAGLIIVILIILASGAYLWSQKTGKAIINVIDQDGLPMDGVNISLGRLPLGTIDPGFSINWPSAGSMDTNQNGEAKFINLQDGIYRIRIEKKGYHHLEGAYGFTLSESKPKEVELIAIMVNNLSGSDLTVHLKFNQTNKTLNVKECNHGDKTLGTGETHIPLIIGIGDSVRDYRTIDFGRAAPTCGSSGTSLSYWGFKPDDHGTYEVRAVIDPNNIYNEIDETNNETKLSITF